MEPGLDSHNSYDARLARLSRWPIAWRPFRIIFEAELVHLLALHELARKSVSPIGAHALIHTALQVRLAQLAALAIIILVPLQAGEILAHGRCAVACLSAQAVQQHAPS